jgi:hypothetical protein
VDILATVNSKRGIPVRLTHERLSHIVESHDYMAGHLDLVVETLWAILIMWWLASGASCWR